MARDKFEVACSIEKRIIWFSGVICADSSGAIVKALYRLSRKRGPIYFYITGPGGDFKYCLGLGKIIQYMTDPVIGIVHGNVNSACFVLSQFFKICTGVKGAKLGFHKTGAEIKLSKGSILTQDALQDQLDRLRLTDAMILNIFFKKYNGSIDDLMDLLVKDSVISLSQAIKFGLIDEYIDEAEFLDDRRLMRRILRGKK